MLSDEFARSSALHAARTLLHLRLAEADGAAPERIAHRLDGFAWEPLPGDGLKLRCAIARWENAGGARLFIRYFTFRAGPGGGELAEDATGVADESLPDPFEPTWAVNRVRAFAHRWLWVWENLRDVSAFEELLADENLDLRLRAGEALRTRAAFEQAARALDAGVGATHHVLAALGVDAKPACYAVRADVEWRGCSTGGTPLRARTRHAWELIETGERYPRLRRLRVELAEPLRAAVDDEARGPRIANAPSDDAEAGGP